MKYEQGADSEEEVYEQTGLPLITPEPEIDPELERMREYKKGKTVVIHNHPGRPKKPETKPDVPLEPLAEGRTHRKGARLPGNKAGKFI